MDISMLVTVGTSVVAVVGTLAGTLLAGWMHSRSARAAQAVADAKARRSEVLSTVTALVQALGDHRRAQTVRARERDRVLSLAGDVAAADGQYTPAVHQTRSAITGPSITLRIICPELAEAAARAVGATFAIRGAESIADVEHLRLQSKLACDALVVEAGRILARDA
ncbi:protein kilB [Kitasatospora indigofera]|uniref:protein kilB n=1 Tax=Kitasatospora indigofera TaxID=67307 RepID=UPI003669E625